MTTKQHVPRLQRQVATHARRSARQLSLALLAAALAATGVAGQAVEPPAAVAACTPSVVKLCPLEALAGDHAAAKRCLLKKLRRASAECRRAVEGQPAGARGQAPKRA